MFQHTNNVGHKLYLIAYLILIPHMAFAQGATTEIVDSALCHDVEFSVCVRPIVNGNVCLSDLKNIDTEHVLFYWTSVKSADQRDILHLWTATNRKDPWAEKIHVSNADKLLAFASGFAEVVASFYGSLDAFHNIQGVVLGVNKSPRYRTHSLIKITPGTYSVTTTDFNLKEITGSRKLTVSVDNCKR